MDLKAIKERCERLKAMNESPELDSFDEELVCTLVDDVPALVAWVERAATYLRQLDMFGVGPSHWADGTWEEISQLLAELD